MNEQICERFAEMNAYRCQQCSREFEWKCQVDHHVLRTHLNVRTAELWLTVVEPEQFQCVCCSFASYNNGNLYEHCKQLHHGRTDEVNTEHVSFDRISYLCHCKYTSNSSLNFIKHAESCETEARFASDANLPPDEDDTRDDTKTIIESNVAKKHQFIKCSAGKRFVCTTCSYQSNNKSHLKEHMMRHANSEDIDWLTCSECSYRTIYKKSLRHHMVKHVTTEDTDCIACTKCSYRTRKKCNFKVHMLQHASSDEIDWFLCAKCSFRTKHKRNLSRHMVCHQAASEDSDWFLCAQCSYKTKNKSLLRRHVAQHDGKDYIDWFVCTKCSYKTGQKSNLKRHVLQHAASDEIDWFVCAKCSYQTKFKSNLNKHNRSRRHMFPNEDVSY